jgi:hypothetical protein
MVERVRVVRRRGEIKVGRKEAEELMDDAKWEAFR